MANKPDTKKKILFILDVLRKDTDALHPMSAKVLAERLEAEGLPGERKSIYRDIATLQDYGYDIEQKEGRNGGFYLLDNTFDPTELRILADAVSASRFISEDQAHTLQEKIGSLTNQYEARYLKRQVVVQNRSKNSSNQIFYTIDAISRSIENDHALTFQYAERNANKEEVLRRDGQIYTVSPAFLLWANENYYLVAYSHKDQEIRHYRVDRMRHAFESQDPREGLDLIRSLKASDYAENTFGMFRGDERSVKLVFDKYLANVLLDRFGDDIPMHVVDEKTAFCHVSVQISPQFFGWLCGIGAGIRIESPKDVKEAYQAYLKEVLEAQ